MASPPPSPPPPASHPLVGMTRLSNQVWFRDAPAGHNSSAASPDTPSSVPPPRLIIVASWMGARDAHIAKYTSHYQSLYPTSSLLLIKFIPAQMWSLSTANNTVAPAITYLRSNIDAGLISLPASGLPSHSTQQQQQPQVHIHIFSNGGSTTLQNLHAAWNSSFPTTTSSTFPPHTTIYDSTPGLPSLHRTYAAFSISLLPKSRPLRFLLSPILYLACLSSIIYVRFILRYFLIPLRLSRQDALTRNFEQLNDSPNFTGPETSRTYIYSKEDPMIGWRDVERHAGEAAKGHTQNTSDGRTNTAESSGESGKDHRNGTSWMTKTSIPCQLEMFHGSGHVAHMRHDPVRYWKIVVDTWERGFR